MYNHSLLSVPRLPALDEHYNENVRWLTGRKTREGHQQPSSIRQWTSCSRSPNRWILLTQCAWRVYRRAFWRTLTSHSSIHVWTFAKRHTGMLLKDPSDLAACLGELGFRLGVSFLHGEYTRSPSYDAREFQLRRLVTLTPIAPFKCDGKRSPGSFLVWDYEIGATCPACSNDHEQYTLIRAKSNSMPNLREYQEKLVDLGCGVEFAAMPTIEVCAKNSLVNDARPITDRKLLPSSAPEIPFNMILNQSGLRLRFETAVEVRRPSLSITSLPTHVRLLRSPYHLKIIQLPSSKQSLALFIKSQAAPESEARSLVIAFTSGKNSPLLNKEKTPKVKITRLGVRPGNDCTTATTDLDDDMEIFQALEGKLRACWGWQGIRLRFTGEKDFVKQILTERYEDATPLEDYVKLVDADISRKDSPRSPEEQASKVKLARNVSFARMYHHPLTDLETGLLEEQAGVLDVALTPEDNVASSS
ncbi:hypothetical protein ARMGADRAFT_1163709 [Armillaria gallica]|uniref:Uncharacterized protein n=1 Tax=Armillaria gallica TaxID=47427 RepID=A0A2H3DLR5_ARMGA|nr:hypothetical protein ARMGADRAFT_1163709 [Armillaria gallica]